MLLTGASGFVGRSLVAHLAEAGVDTLGIYRRPPDAPVPGRMGVVASIDDTTDWRPWLEGHSVVIHLAALAHRTDPRDQPSAEEFHRINVLGPLRLAESASAAGVRRFVFMSSIGVHGISSDRPLDATSAQDPQEPYARSKLEAEQALRQLMTRSGLEVVIVRAPMVYGPRCPGNLLRLLKLIDSGIPLPLGGMGNLRSLVGVDNLAAFLHLCASHPSAAGQVFHIADEPDVSTTRLVELLARGMGRRPRLFRIPLGLLLAAAGIAGRREVIEKLCGSLRVDSTLARDRLGWRQPRPLDEGLEEVGRWFAHANP